MTHRTRISLSTSALALLATVALAPGRAEAHFYLTQPASWDVQDTMYGNPQKSAPCGQADPGTTAQPTNMVTTYHAGDTISITIDEKITHPGHYRVQIAQDMNSIPADPPVTAGSTPCGSTVINPNPTPPLIADGLLVHTAAFSGPQTVQVKLPANLTCTNCVMQVAEFMSNHGLNNPGGCFYHHCANINILPAATPDGGTAADMTTAPAADLASGGGGTMSTGCSYQSAAVPTSAAAFTSALLALGLLLRRRRA